MTRGRGDANFRLIFVSHDSDARERKAGSISERSVATLLLLRSQFTRVVFWPRYSGALFLHRFMTELRPVLLASKRR